jgi:hypothetical protein
MKYFFLPSLILFSLLISCHQPSDEKKSDAPKPSGNCTLARDEKDPMGRRTRMVEDQKFISADFSDSAAKVLYKNEEYFKGYISCISVDSVLGIYFDFKVHSDNAYQYYGMIMKGNKITFILKSGNSVELPFGATFSGNTDLSKEVTEYLSFAHLPHSAAVLLQSEELQRVKISWSKKEEEYTVIYPNVFIDQLPCIQ